MSGGIGVAAENISGSCSSGCQSVSSIDGDDSGAGVLLTGRVNFGRAFLQGDLIGFPGADSGSSVTIGAGIHLGSFSISGGIGQFDASASATLTGYSAPESKVSADGGYIEIGHSSGLFARYSKFNTTQHFSFSRLSPPATAPRSVKLDYEQLVAGYRYLF